MNADVQNRTGTTLVRAAQAGDRQAQEALVAAWLPLVYNVAGRALGGHADVDDVAQETMIRALDGLDGLREPESFRSWLVAITMNQVRRRHAAGQQQPTVGGLDETWEVADPRADFTDLTILRLGLSGQRREVAEATRWLDPDDRELLALWWLEASGELSRAELAEALDLSPQHAAVRVQRMKKQLEAGRVVVRALGAYPRCPQLAEVTVGFDGTPNSVWRKRIARHIRGCAGCDGLGRDLFPAEGLLAGLAMVPIPSTSPTLLHLQHTAATAATAGHSATAVGAAGTGPGAAGTGTTGTAGTAGTTGTAGAGSGTGSGAATGTASGSGGHGGWAGAAARKAVLASGAAAAVAVTTLALVWPNHGEPPSTAAPEPSTPAAAMDTPAALPATPSATPTPTPTPTPSETPTSTPTPTPTATRSATAAPPPNPERQLVDLVNAERAKAGCAPLRIDPRLHSSAQKHADDMAARGFFDHVNPDGVRPDARITAAGYRWSQWGENLDRGPTTPAAVFARWMDGGIHQSNMLDCGLKDIGVGVAASPAGTLWTQDLGAPMS
ncbi:sigma-70 family RNA polymerase sigma factor [Streptomyces viridifaciens]|uniref:sigma-70 family RNA polymerase sigma factor n=1 Tax=Kitasatospora aureofaciens TaxID=1894 RepID=UPI00123C8A2E|nr:sigma-70 family RNA polymerase sigma factor [Streptomyces viridifaciens]UKZ09753.1 sigma-70 family RNA polymerase sigma factor [Streptomyces viridifaciens]